ncbi:hypothetical protein LTR62_008883 [Meristemomyces frigidus]|uniref:Uncharacterized protein n=1 Tax=Meristemomyces frigidus TaxID=1508187 RepID=A0AAN7TAE5_9PEZI|nr:hypothetical protein LTR62_008883 [Meristemomyces frigidus]
MDYFEDPKRKREVDSSDDELTVYPGLRQPVLSHAGTHRNVKIEPNTRDLDDASTYAPRTSATVHGSFTPGFTLPLSHLDPRYVQVVVGRWECTDCFPHVPAFESEQECQ